MHKSLKLARKFVRQTFNTTYSLQLQNEEDNFLKMH